MQTLELLQIAATTDVVIDDELYGADANELLARLRHVPAAIGSVLLVGHNPGIEDLARTLAGDALALEEKFPTAALADLRLPIRTWAELDSGIGQLHAFVIPRSLG